MYKVVGWKQPRLYLSLAAYRCFVQAIRGLAMCDKLDLFPKSMSKNERKI